METVRKMLLIMVLAMGAVYGNDVRAQINHIIVVYMENRSFDNLFRGFDGADTSDHPNIPYGVQLDAAGKGALALAMGMEGVKAGLPQTLPNAPFLLDRFIPQNGMIPDMVHRFYENRLQINGGKNDRFAQLSDGGVLVMGYHDMNRSALWEYAKEFTLCDRFFAAAFGGSFLNHQWLIAAQTPYVGNDTNISRYVLDAKGEVIQAGILTPDGYAVNTVQPHFPPFKSKDSDPALRLPPLKYDTIGDRLSEQDVSWGWYSGGYDQAVAGEGEKVHYQYHHNPFLYFVQYAPGSEGRTHLKDEKAFFSELAEGTLPSVVFFKPSAEENQHPGYATVASADGKLRQIVEAVRARPGIWNRSLIIVTYDENGGLWDHVAPPAGDRWGPGTRVPALVISPFAKKGYVDHTEYDTTSVLRLIEWRYGLDPLGERSGNNLARTLESID